MKYLNCPKCMLAAASLTLVFLGGCASVPIYEQQIVSKTGMTFSDSIVESSQTNLTIQIEPGSAVSGGAQAAGCTACR